jgi:hypothetical protein
MLPFFFKLSLLKLYLFAPKGYAIALQPEEKNGCAFNALEKNQIASCCWRFSD